MNFQKTVLTISIVLLIVALIVFGSMIYTDKSEYPPVAAQCPDYWIDMSGGMGTGGYCINTKNLGKGTCKNRMNFNGGLWSGDDGLCNKNKWANACGPGPPVFHSIAIWIVGSHVHACLRTFNGLEVAACVDLAVEEL